MVGLRKLAYLAVVLSVEVANDNGPASVELEDLVVGCEGTTAVDVGSARLLQEGRGVLADLRPPHVLERAGSAAVDALGLRGTDDDVGESGAVLEDEHRVLLTGLGLALADIG